MLTKDDLKTFPLYAALKHVTNPSAVAVLRDERPAWVVHHDVLDLLPMEFRPIFSVKVECDPRDAYLVSHPILHFHKENGSPELAKTTKLRLSVDDRVLAQGIASWPYITVGNNLLETETLMYVVPERTGVVSEALRMDGVGHADKNQPLGFFVKNKSVITLEMMPAQAGAMRLGNLIAGLSAMRYTTRKAGGTYPGVETEL